MSEQFSLHRVGLLLRNDALNRYRTVLIVSLLIALIMLIGAMGVAYGGGGEAGAYTGQFLGTLFLWGTLAASVSFGDLHSKSRNTEFLLLPASALEKTFARLVYHSVGLVAYLLVLTTVVSFIAEGINLLLLGRRNGVFQSFDSVIWRLLPHFLVVQSLFFVGAAWFRRAQWLKTTLSIAILLCGFFAVFIALAWAVGLARWSGAALDFDGDFYSAVYRPLRWLFDTVFWAVYFVALPVFCWFVVWLRVKETQVSHGV